MKRIISALGAFFIAVFVGSFPVEGQPIRRPQIDPFLFEAIDSVTRAAAEAEADPKRGPGNAVALLEAAKTTVGSPALRMALDLRIAATHLRKRFLSARRFEEHERHAQALSTFSRLDLREPGLPGALRATLAARRAVLRREGEPVQTPDLTLELAILTQSKSVDPRAFGARLRAALKPIGVKLMVVEPSAADLHLKLGARGITEGTGARAIRTTLTIEAYEDGQRVWEHRLFRTATAESAEAALDAGLEWLVRIGGRDVLFHHLAGGPIPELSVLGTVAGGSDHDHHHHGHRKRSAQ